MLALALAIALFAQSAEIQVSYSEDMPDAARADFETAAQIWERCLLSDAPIRIHVDWIERGPTGFATSRKLRGLAHLSRQNVWYASALANAIAGARDSDADDMNIFLSARTNWYFENETAIAEGQTDFINVALHEIAHGLGISSASFIPWQGEPVATMGLRNPFVNFFDYTFDLNERDGTPELYDTFIRLGDGRRLDDFPNSSMALTLALANPTVHFAGENARAANDGYLVGVVPTNISHIPAFPRSPNPIMLPDSGQGESLHRPDAILLGMLADLGWEVSEVCVSD